MALLGGLRFFVFSIGDPHETNIQSGLFFMERFSVGEMF